MKKPFRRDPISHPHQHAPPPKTPTFAREPSFPLSSCLSILGAKAIQQQYQGYLHLLRRPFGVLLPLSPAAFRLIGTGDNGGSRSMMQQENGAYEKHGRPGGSRAWARSGGAPTRSTEKLFMKSENDATP